jgi:cytochrome c553
MSEERCVHCHKLDGIAPPVEPGRIGKTAQWLEMHVADPIVLAPGLRDAPQTSQGETHGILMALARMRTSAPPQLDHDTRRTYMLLNKFCMNCHIIDGVGGKEGPDLTHAGSQHDEASIEQRIIDPTVLDPVAEMPALGDKISTNDIRLIASWLARRK